MWRDEIIEHVPGWSGRDVHFDSLPGGLAHETYVAHMDGERYVVKFLTDDMVRYHLMIPHDQLIHNTRSAGETGVGARLITSLFEPSVMVLEYIEGRTLEPADLSKREYIPRFAAALRKLHTSDRPFANELNIFRLLDKYLEITEENGLRTPDRYYDYLPLMRRIEGVLSINALPLVPCNNDLLAANLMDQGDAIRVIDYDFSGMNDACFELGDLAVEGRYNPDQIVFLCEEYFGASRPTQVARARLFRAAAQYTWTLLFAAMQQVLDPLPDPTFDYWAEAELRWTVALSELEGQEFGAVLKQAQKAE